MKIMVYYVLSVQLLDKCLSIISKREMDHSIDES